MRKEAVALFFRDHGAIAPVYVAVRTLDRVVYACVPASMNKGRLERGLWSLRDFSNSYLLLFLLDLGEG